MVKAQQYFSRAGILFALAILTGCQSTFTNQTPEGLRQNLSGIYTFSFRANVPATAVQDTLRAYITINGDTYPMVQSAQDVRVFTFDFPIPPGVTEARYYYTLEFTDRTRPLEKARRIHSTDEGGQIFVTRLLGRYTVDLLIDRGPVGAPVTIFGQGFAPGDVVLVGNVEASSRLVSPTTLEFTVPALPAGQSYPVVVRSGDSELLAGQFRVDAAPLRAFPRELELTSGEVTQIIFETDVMAPTGGLPLEVATDIPNSVIMPEATIAEGQRSVSVPVRGGEPGSGSLYITVPGFDTLVIPVTVR